MPKKKIKLDENLIYQLAMKRLKEVGEEVLIFEDGLNFIMIDTAHNNWRTVSVGQAELFNNITKNLTKWFRQCKIKQPYTIESVKEYVDATMTDREVLIWIDDSVDDAVREAVGAALKKRKNKLKRITT